MAMFIAKNQRGCSSYVSVTNAPSFVLKNVYDINEAAATRAARRVSYLIGLPSQVTLDNNILL
jgi:hypothetical protein